MKFYHFNQNNSGGYYLPPALNILVEAVDEKVAGFIANQSIEDHSYCHCCGPRWNLSISYNEYDSASDYKMDTTYKGLSQEGIPQTLIIYNNGEKELIQ